MIPIKRKLEDELISHHESNSLGERLFQAAYEAFRDGVKNSKLALPKG
jgi:hypothetical protein